MRRIHRWKSVIMRMVKPYLIGPPQVQLAIAQNHGHRQAIQRDYEFLKKERTVRTGEHAWF